MAGCHVCGITSAGGGEVKNFCQWFLAFLHLSDKAVCEQSTSERDYHDYPDAIEHDPKTDYPMYFFNYHCKRCGKEFMI